MTSPADLVLRCLAGILVLFLVGPILLVMLFSFSSNRSPRSRWAIFPWCGGRRCSPIPAFTIHSATV